MLEVREWNSHTTQKRESKDTTVDGRMSPPILTGIPNTPTSVVSPPPLDGLTILGWLLLSG